MIRRIALLTSLLVISSGCSGHQPVEPTEPSDIITSAEYAVLAAIVDSVVFVPSNSVLILRDSTRPGISSYDIDSALTSTLQYVARDIAVLKAETMLDFKAKNLTHFYIDSPTDIDPRCVRSSTSSAVYPMLEVSRVGFSVDGRQALAYVGYTYAKLAGSGIYYVLSWQDAKWKISGAAMIWIS